jgi:cobalt transporter subunit CbtB
MRLAPTADVRQNCSHDQKIADALNAPETGVRPMTDRLSHIASRVVIGGSNIWADSSRIAGFAALLLGVFLVLGVGFAGSEIIHNAAHDGRHSMAFPCH